MRKTDDTRIEFIETSSQKLDDILANSEYRGAFIHIHDEGDSDTDDMLYIGSDRVTDNLNTRDENLSTPTRKVGCLEASTLGELKKKPLSEIIIDIVKEERVVPTQISSPSVSISYSGSKVIEVGTQLPVGNNITVTVNPGLWSDGTQYAGECTTILNMTPDKWGETSEERVYNISASGTFTAGNKPKDNYGDEYPAYSGGNVTSNTIKITSVKPIYINDGQSITTMVKHIVDYLNGVELMVSIPAEGEEPEEFGTMTVKQMNTFTGKYDIDIPMVFVSGETLLYMREDISYTNTDVTQYKINLKK